MKRLRVAVVGLDHYHVTGWVESLGYFEDRIEIVGLYDPDPERGRALRPTFSDPHLSAALPASFAALPFHTNLDRLLDEVRPDLALVTMLNHAAPAAVEQLAKAGVHMLVDKPGARTAAEARRAFGAAKAAGVRVGVGLGKRHARMWHDFREAAASARFGRLLSGEAIFITSSVKVRDPRNFLFRRELSGGGILHWLAIHDLDALTWLTRQRVTEVQAVSGTMSGEAIDVEDTISASLRLEGGAIVTLHYAYALPRRGNEGYMALRGSGGSLRVALGGGLEWVGPGDRSDPVASQQTVYSLMDARGYGTAGIYIVGDLLDAIEQGREPLATGADLVRALALIEAIYEAARTGERMRVAIAD
jgi:predicted dehydrogenase